jgi:quercetin dioxygenase-like cupin family protein
MNYSLPHTIQNCVGEKIIFQKVEKTPDGDRLTGEAFCDPGCGPIMHTHFKQDEGMLIISGRMGYQILGEEPCFAGPGESVVFKRGVPHKFWAADNQPLHCKAWLQPVNTIIFYLTAIYAAQNKSGSGKPEVFDGAYLLKRYASEYDLVEMPWLVKKVVIPLTYYSGMLLGKYKHFKNAPKPVIN